MKANRWSRCKLKDVEPTWWSKSLGCFVCIS